MSAKGLYFITPDISVAQSPAVEDILNLWPKASRPELQCIGFDQLMADNSLIKNARAAWIFAGDNVEENILF